MKTINGIPVTLDISSFIKIADFIYYDGPLLSHYISDRGENYLFYWVDVDNNFNRSYFFFNCHKISFIEVFLLTNHHLCLV